MKTSAQLAGEVCERLERKGELIAANLVDVSRPENAPLHSEFEWNDSYAAEKYREGQARLIIRSIVTAVEVENQSEVTVRAFLNVEVEDAEYHGIGSILSSEDLHAKMLRTAKQELRAFQKKYETLMELQPVFEAADAIGA